MVVGFEESLSLVLDDEERPLSVVFVPLVVGVIFEKMLVVFVAVEVGKLAVVVLDLLRKLNAEVGAAEDTLKPEKLPNTFFVGGAWKNFFFIKIFFN